MRRPSARRRRSNATGACSAPRAWQTLPRLREQHRGQARFGRDGGSISHLGRGMQRREFIRIVLGSALLWKAPALLASQAATPPAPDPEVKRVLVMFK